MVAQPANKHRNSRVAAALVLFVCTAPTAFARVAANTIDPLARVSDTGRHLTVTGPIACTESERAFIRVTVTQRTTGAVAAGHTVLRCTGNPQQWEVHAQTDAKATFEQGAATAVALAHTVFQGETTDAHQWLVNITLIGA